MSSIVLIYFLGRPEEALLKKSSMNQQAFKDCKTTNAYIVL